MRKWSQIVMAMKQKALGRRPNDCSQSHWNVFNINRIKSQMFLEVLGEWFTKNKTWQSAGLGVCYSYNVSWWKTSSGKVRKITPLLLGMKTKLSNLGICFYFPDCLLILLAWSILVFFGDRCKCSGLSESLI